MHGEHTEIVFKPNTGQSVRMEAADAFAKRSTGSESAHVQRDNISHESEAERLEHLTVCNGNRSRTEPSM